MDYINRFFKFQFVLFLFCFESCFIKNSTSEIICENVNCFTVVQNRPFTNEGESGIYFFYGKDKEQDNFVHVRYTDGAFYYRWNNDTLILRCPYWKVVEDKRKTNKLFDFQVFFTDAERLKYHYDLGVIQFYKNLSKDFAEVNTYQLK